MHEMRTMILLGILTSPAPALANGWSVVLESEAVGSLIEAVVDKGADLLTATADGLRSDRAQLLALGAQVAKGAATCQDLRTRRHNAQAAYESAKRDKEEACGEASAPSGGGDAGGASGGSGGSDTQLVDPGDSGDPTKLWGTGGGPALTECEVQSRRMEELDSELDQLDADMDSLNCDYYGSAITGVAR